MHRRTVLKSTVAGLFGLAIGTTPTLFANSTVAGNRKCNFECSTLPLAGPLRPDKWGGPNTRAGHTHLQYYIDSRGNGFEENIWDLEIEKSFKSWEQVTNLSFEKVDGGEPDIFIGFSQRRRSGFGKTGGVLAWAELPSNRQYDGQLWSMFDTVEDWRLDPDPQQEGVLFRAVCAHEIGHLLGLGHSQYKSALMYPYYNDFIETPQEKDDIPRIQRLYGKK